MKTTSCFSHVITMYSHVGKIKQNESGGKKQQLINKSEIYCINIFLNNENLSVLYTNYHAFGFIMRSDFSFCLKNYHVNVTMLYLLYFYEFIYLNSIHFFSFWECLNLRSPVDCRPSLMLTYFRAILMYYSARTMLFLNMDTHSQIGVTQADLLHHPDNDWIQSYRLFGSRVQWQVV